MSIRKLTGHPGAHNQCEKANVLSTMEKMMGDE
jgi:hypothetical protein